MLALNIKREFLLELPFLMEGKPIKFPKRNVGHDDSHDRLPSKKSLGNHIEINLSVQSTR